MNIYEAISKITQKLPAIPKTHQGQGVNYKFRGIDDIYQVLQPLMAEYQVNAWPEVLTERYETVTTKSGGTATRCFMKVKWKFVCAADPKTAEYVTIASEALDTSDKATNKALTASDKYACLLLFKIPTEEPKDTEEENIEIEKKTPLKNGSSPEKVSSGAAVTRPTEAQEPGDYIVTFGKYKDTSVRELVDVHSQPKIMSYISWLQADSRDKKKPMTQAVNDFIEAFDAFIGTSELDKALESTAKESLDQKVSRLKNEYPGVKGPPMPTPYKSDDEPMWDPNEQFPEQYK